MAGERRCSACGSPLAADQGYCLVCGERAGERSPRLEGLMRNVREADTSPGPTLLAPEPPPPSTGAGLQLPGPWVSAALVLAFVGFGALLGNAGSKATLSASSSPLHVVVPSTPSTAGGGGAAGAGGGSSSEPTGTEAPSSEPEASPSEPASPNNAKQATSTTPNKAGEAEEAEQQGGAGGGSQPKHGKLTEIKHVFVIMLSEEPYASDFGPESKDTYLAKTLEPKGALLARYDAVAHEGLPNGIALLSGQGPTGQTASDCPIYAPLEPAGSGQGGQALGSGCVYPGSVPALPHQLAAKHLGWRAYVQGTDEGPSTPAACTHPALGEADPTLTAGDYATYRNPFVYFASITGSPECQADDVGLTRLKPDLASAHPPALSYIVPDRCHDAGGTPCAPGAPTGAGDAAPFLQLVVPEIMASAAYKHGGLIVITADDAPSKGEFADSGSCCGQPASYPNYKAPTIGQGGGNVGALLLSPLIKGGKIAQESYDHYSLLRTIEDVFGLSHIGYAGLAGVSSLSASLLTKG